jgi:hypothetical protein
MLITNEAILHLIETEGSYYHKPPIMNKEEI